MIEITFLIPDWFLITMSVLLFILIIVDGYKSYLKYKIWKMKNGR